MTEYQMKMKMLEHAIVVVGKELGWKRNRATSEQALLWLNGVRDGRIADVTIQAVDLLRRITLR